MKKNLSTSITNLQVIVLALFSVYAGFIIEAWNGIDSMFSSIINFTLIYCILLTHNHAFINQKYRNFLDFLDLILLLVAIRIFYWRIVETIDNVNVGESPSYLEIDFIVLFFLIGFIIRKIIKIFKHKIDLSNSDTNVGQTRDFKKEEQEL